MTSFAASNRTKKKWRIARPLSHTLRRVSLALVNFLRHKHHFAESPSPLIEANERCRLLTEIRTAIRLGLLDEAAQGITSMGRSFLRDADCLNLLGVIEESRHAWKSACRWYGKAIRADRSHPAAQQNMRRIYELQTFGWSRQPVALGDERPALCELLDARERSRNRVDSDSSEHSRDEVGGNSCLPQGHAHD